MPSNKANAVRRKGEHKTTLPGPIREALRAKASRDAERDEDLRRLPLVRAFRKIYERQPYFIGQDEAAQERWRKSIALRIVEFCSVAKTFALEEIIRALKPREGTRSDIKQWTDIAIELLKAGLAGDQRQVYRLIKACPVEERWDVVFNDRWLLDQILEPTAPSHATDVAETGEHFNVPNSFEIFDTSDSGQPVDADDSCGPVLGTREMDVLVVLYEEKAFDSDNRITIREIADRAVGEKADHEQFKRVILQLKKHGYVKTVRGQSGGCLLTAIGRTRAESCKASFGRSPAC